MRAYRARQREGYARLVDPADAPRTVADNHRLRERVAQLTDERNRLWAQVVRLQQHVRELERAQVGEPLRLSTSGAGAVSRAERRRLEREQARKQRRFR